MRSAITSSASTVQASRRYQRSDDAETARLALDKVWRELAPILDEARDLQLQVAQKPSLSTDPWVGVHTGWLQVFERELDAIQTVYNTTEAGAKLSVEELRATREVAEKILGFIVQGQQRIRQPA
jgi:hypothetical protein